MLFKFMCHKVPFAIDTLSDFIFLGNLKTQLFFFGLFYSAVKEAVFGNTRRRSLRLKISIWCLLVCLNHSKIKCKIK